MVDFSAFVAGPLAAQVLADLGAEVIKVEPPGGEAMRGAAYAIAACQRGKRSLAMDIGAADARPVVERLITWADVVLHNFRVGVSERLGIDEASVARLNPHAVYCHASAFGPTGPARQGAGERRAHAGADGVRARHRRRGQRPDRGDVDPDRHGRRLGRRHRDPGRAVRPGDERSRPAGGDEPARRRDAAPQRRVPAGRRVVRGPELDAGQTGYGPGYRLYEAGDGGWLALVLPDPEAWERLRSLPEAASLPAAYAPLRGGPDDAVALEAEAVLEAAFATAAAADWVARLRALGLLAERVETMDRDAVPPGHPRRSRQPAARAGRRVRHGRLGPLRADRPAAAVRAVGGGGPPLMLPGIGEHSAAVLTDLGFGADEIDALLAAKVVRQG